METVHKVVDAASHAIWGEANTQDQHNQSLEQHGDEPLSGIQGKGSATDPYDAGNRDEQPGAPSTKENTAVVTGPPPDDLPSDIISAKKGTDSSMTELSPRDQENQVPSGNSGKEDFSSQSQNVEQRSQGQGQSENTSEGQRSKQSQQSEPKEESKEASSKQESSKEEPSKESSKSADDYEQNPDVKVSEEALRGPKTPAPREAFEFEKRMDAKGQPPKPDGDGGAAKEPKPSQQEHHHDGSATHHNKPITYMKDKLGRVVKAGNHLHHSNK
ncbi:hypothetical protein ASPWEDRAFT_170797 [Aspergillus wentii DTO 134E9]|uniref:Uncharacterized protein n=1 Tax=Aspergillus wentii DTO 134E9 TaxID=1073089 RepID=A0A1L9RQV4_ASPWE|nr:uncharacterized protein ASPWEDRAFT_170797 [Aspergillus wentii DTO 134E9]KAI9928205.1 hypothetical protein MW887_002238 [Aspergillus wentii]OJJ37311.1 hypothetical protein ASPWEDRAFT_170797 [Aspergillus wentii DTO 134E9]